MDGWMDRGIGGWMDGWIHTYIHTYSLQSVDLMGFTMRDVPKWDSSDRWSPGEMERRPCDTQHAWLARD